MVLTPLFECSSDLSCVGLPVPDEPASANKLQ